MFVGGAAQCDGNSRTAPGATGLTSCWGEQRVRAHLGIPGLRGSGQVTASLGTAPAGWHWGECSHDAVDLMCREQRRPQEAAALLLTHWVLGKAHWSLG